MTQRVAAFSMFVALAACGGGNFTPAPTPTPSPEFYACFFSGAVPPSTLTSPIPGATGVPDSTPALLFSNALETPYGRPTINVTFGSQGFYYTDIVSATASGYSVALPALMPDTTYTVYALFNVPSGDGSCPTFPVEEGTFTTQ